MVRSLSFKVPMVITRHLNLFKFLLKSCHRLWIEMWFFGKLLEGQRFAQFKNLNYEPKRISPDSVTYMLTSRDGTVRYNALPIDGLPANLRAVVEAWSQLRGSAREIGP